MDQFELNAEKRLDVGKGASRRLRHAGKVPAVVYGGGKQPLSLQLDHNEMLRHLEHEAFYSHILTLKLDSDAEKVVLKDLQRHPHKPQVLHLDLLRIDEHEKLAMRVPVHCINEDKCFGVKHQGGVISHLLTEIEIRCLPKDLPEYIEVDLANVHVGTTLHIADIAMPEGVEIMALVHGGDPTQPVVSVHVPRVAAEAEEAEAAPAAAGVGGEATGTGEAKAD